MINKDKSSEFLKEVDKTINNKYNKLLKILFDNVKFYIPNKVIKYENIQMV